MKNKKDEQSSPLYTKSTLRNVIFVIITLILLPMANLCRAFIAEKTCYAQLERYSVELFQENQVNFVEFFLKNLDKATPFFFTFLIWVPFAVIGLLLVKLIYRKHEFEKQVLKVTLIAHCVKIGLFLILCGGSVVIKLIFPTRDLFFVDKILMDQFTPGYYGFTWFNKILDIAFTISLTWGMLYMYRTQIRHGIIKTLGGKVS